LSCALCRKVVTHCIFVYEIQGDSVARGTKMLSMKNYVTEIMT